MAECIAAAWGALPLQGDMEMQAAFQAINLSWVWYNLPSQDASWRDKEYCLVVKAGDHVTALTDSAARSATA